MGEHPPNISILSPPRQPASAAAAFTILKPVHGALFFHLLLLNLQQIEPIILSGKGERQLS